MKVNNKQFFSAILMASTVLLTGIQTHASEAEMQSKSEMYKEKAKDAWIDGKLEMAYTLNSHLNPFDIDTQVHDSKVHLAGVVDSDIDKDLAGRIAKGIDGVTEVDNDLRVETQPSKGSALEARADSFANYVSDAYISAKVKTALLADKNIKGLDIQVDTKSGVVTLTGPVHSEQQEDLAVQIASNTKDVTGVNNELIVISQ